MALARLALKNIGQRVVSPSSSSLPVCHSFAERSLSTAQNQRWASEILRYLSTKAGEQEKSEDRQVAVSEDGKKSRLFPRRQRRKRSLWRNNSRDFVPSLSDFLPSGLGNALLQATDNINRLLENLAPSGLTGRVKEQDDCYKLRYHVPGLGKEDVKITVEDGILTIKGEHKEEDEQASDDEFWSSTAYEYYNSSLVLPEDAKADEIKAELMDGVLTIIIPRTQTPKKDVKEVPIH